MEAPAPTEVAAVTGEDGARETLSRARPGRGTRDLTLPNLIVIGAQKCGTSGLHYYLEPPPRGLDVDAEGAQLLHRGAQLAARPRLVLAPLRPGGALPRRGVAQLHRLPAAPRRARADAPRSSPTPKLLYIVRDPIERIAAHWVHNYAKRREKGDLRATLLHPNTSYVTRSQYHMQLQRFLAHFDERADPRPRAGASSATTGWRRCARLFEFAGVDPGLRAPALRAGPPLDLAQEARDPARHAGAADEPHAASAAGSRAAPGSRSTSPCRSRSRSSGHRRRRGARARGARGPARGRRAAARADRARVRPLVGLSARGGNDRKNRNQRKRRKGEGGPKRPDKGGRHRRGTRHPGAPLLGHPRDRDGARRTRSRSRRRSSSPTSPSPASSASSAC